MSKLPTNFNLMFVNQWMLMVQGIDPYCVKSIKSITENQIEIELYLFEEMKELYQPTSTTGVVKHMNHAGNIVAESYIEWDHHVTLPFDLSYDKQCVATYKIILKNAKTKMVIFSDKAL